MVVVGDDRGQTHRYTQGSRSQGQHPLLITCLQAVKSLPIIHQEASARFTASMAPPALVPASRQPGIQQQWRIIRLDGNLHHPRELDSKKDARDRERRGNERARGSRPDRS